MRIGILGSGLIGSKLGTIFARAGHEVVFSYSRSKAEAEEPRSQRSQRRWERLAYRFERFGEQA